MPISAVLFDLDGTLVDSEPIWAVAERAITTRFGVDWKPEDTLHIRGWPLPAAAEYMRERGVDLPAAQILEEMEGYVCERLGEDVPWAYPGARIMSDCVDRGIPTAIVTMSRRAALDIVLDALPPGSVQASVAGDEVRRGKPDPEPYLRAMDFLGVSARECAVLEDSVTGANSGLAAGCRVAMVGPLAGTAAGTVSIDADTDLDGLMAALGRGAAGRP